MIELIKKLREETGVSLGECKKAIEEAKGNVEEAKEILRKRGQDLASKRMGRGANEGIVTSYIHPNNKVGVLLEIRCESDFAARSDDFNNLAKEICLQIAAMSPLFIGEGSELNEALEKERNIYKEQLSNTDKPEEIISKMIEGKLEGYKKDNCLLFQPWVKDNKRTIEELLEEYIAKIGENILIERFSRFEL